MSTHLHHVWDNNNTNIRRERMKIMVVILIIGCLSFASIAKMETTYGDTTKVSIFHKNGKIKVEGVKVKKFKDGKWKYYDENGFLVRVDNYKNGRKIKSMEMGALK
tara:strand:+ start:2680 stop:2997 length:318 start_codon:yes stop_codon:yes gene_type:complete